MKSGTLNESNLIKHLLDCNYVTFVGEVGLVDHNLHVGISVSADTKATFTVGPHVLVRCQHRTVEG